MTAISRRQLRHPRGVTDQLRMKTHRHQLRNKPCRFLKQYLQMIPRKVSKVRKFSFGRRHGSKTSEDPKLCHYSTNNRQRTRNYTMLCRSGFFWVIGRRRLPNNSSSSVFLDRCCSCSRLHESWMEKFETLLSQKNMFNLSSPNDTKQNHRAKRCGLMTASPPLNATALFILCHTFLGTKSYFGFAACICVDTSDAPHVRRTRVVPLRFG